MPYFFLLDYFFHLREAIIDLGKFLSGDRKLRSLRLNNGNKVKLENSEGG